MAQNIAFTGLAILLIWKTRKLEIITGNYSQVVVKCW